MNKKDKKEDKHPLSEADNIDIKRRQAVGIQIKLKIDMGNGHATIPLLNKAGIDNKETHHDPHNNKTDIR